MCRQLPTKRVDLKSSFGNVLRTLRLSREMTQQQVADYAGMDRSFISELERGVLTPSIESLFKLAKVLKIRPRDFIELVEKAHLK